MAMAATTAALIGLGAATATTQVMSSRQQSKALERQGDYNAQVYEQQAEMIKQQQKIQDYQYTREAARLRGAQKARTAGAGLLLSGSPLAMMVDSDTQLRLDKAIGDYNMNIQQNYAKSGANYYRTSASEQAKLARTQGYGNAFATMLQTGAYAGPRLGV